MSLLTPLGLLGLLGVIVLIIIYIIKPNYQSKFISSTFIWKLSLKYKKKKVPLSKLRNILLFICQVLILTAAAFILTQPIIDDSMGAENGDTIIIIDASASMLAESAGSTRFERTVAAVQTHVAELFKDEKRVSVIVASENSYFLVQQAEAEKTERIKETSKFSTITPSCTSIGDGNNKIIT